MSRPIITQVLFFPEGYFLMADDRPYFLPNGSDHAYAQRGERKELMGKIHLRLPTRAPDFKNYDLTYEYENGKLLAARLISPRGRSAGRQLSADIVAMINNDIAAGLIVLEEVKSSPSINRAANFPDGEMLIVVNDYEGAHEVLFKGRPGAFEKIEIQSGLVGGNSLYYTTKAGEKIALPMGLTGPKFDDTPTFGDVVLTYTTVKNRFDLAALGIPVKQQAPHLDPFCPELRGGGNAPRPSTPAP
jgi:hypothetical protein